MCHFSETILLFCQRKGDPSLGRSLFYKCTWVMIFANSAPATIYGWRGFITTTQCPTTKTSGNRPALPFRLYFQFQNKFHYPNTNTCGKCTELMRVLRFPFALSSRLPVVYHWYLSTPLLKCQTAVFFINHLYLIQHRNKEYKINPGSIRLLPYQRGKGCYATYTLSNLVYQTKVYLHHCFLCGPNPIRPCLLEDSICC